jgi:MoxR-like ATPase
VNRFLRAGGSPRGAQALLLAGKVRALLAGRYNVSFEDVKAVFPAALRHRVLLNFEAQAENLASDTILAAVLAGVPEREEGK